MTKYKTSRPYMQLQNYQTEVRRTIDKNINFPTTCLSLLRRLMSAWFIINRTYGYNDVCDQTKFVKKTHLHLGLGGIVVIAGFPI